MKIAEEKTVLRKFGIYSLIAISVIALVALGSLMIPVRNASAAGTISGTVFLDYNLNGARDTSGAAPNFAVDKGVGGVTVTVYDAAGNQQGTDVSSATGGYSVSATGTGPYRVEFGSLPAGYMPGTVGTNNSSSVRFVPNGNSTNIDFGIITIEDYCQNIPELVTTCFAGTVNGNSADPVLVSFPYDSGTTSRTSSAGVTDPTAHSLMVPQNQLGAIWGLAYNRRYQKIFAAAFTKRHAGFRNSNQGTASNDPTGEIFISDPTGNSGSLFVNLNSLFGSNVAGVNPHDTADYQSDVGAFAGVGKTAFGDIELSSDEQTLYAVNLNDRNLYAIPLGSGTPTAPTLASQVTVYDLASIMNPGTSGTGCPMDAATPAGEMNRNLRPGAIKVTGNKIYLGLTCTAQSTGNANQLRAFVYDFNPSGSGSAVQVANVALNYSRGCISDNGTICAPAEWLPWTDTIADLLDFTPWGQKYYPQPWLIDIEIDQDGFMILGVADRVGHQTGNDNSGANTGTVEGVSAGDTLRMYRSGSTWLLENNGSDNTNTTAGAGTGEGPGNGEFYFEEGYTITSNVHSEVSLGGLLNIPGFQDIVVSAFDPAPTNTLPGGENTYRAGGMIWLNNKSGSRSRSYQLFNIDTPNTFGKASGIGDLEAICANAPLQVGNRVWNDANGNGRQDPGEGVFANVALEMWADTTSDGTADTLIGNATTDANGNYLFGGPNNTNLTYNCGSTSGSVDVQVSQSTDDAEQQTNNSVITNSGDLDMFKDNGSGTDYSFMGVRFNSVSIPANATITDARLVFWANNSSSVSSGSPTFTIRAEAADNPPTYTATNNNLSVTTRPRTGASVPWSPPGWSNGTIAPQTPDLSAVVQEVVSRPGWADGNAISFMLSGPAASAYREAETFDGNSARAPRLLVQYTVPQTCANPLLPNTAYEVRVAQSNFNTGNPLANFLPTTPDADPSSNGDARDSDGIIYAGDRVKALFTTADYGSNNHNFDFGFVPAVAGSPVHSLGNRVWFDTDNDGIIDPAESGVANVSVSIFRDSDGNGVPDSPGSPLATISTDAGGYYRFDSLTADTYVVRINPSNFGPSAVLEGYRNTTGINTGDAESFGAGANSENGVDPTASTGALTNGIFSNPITLSALAEPAGEANVPSSGIYAGQGAFDSYADMTVDFGFYGLRLSGTVWADRGAGADNDDGELDPGENTLPGYNIRLYDNIGVEVPVGPDGILGTADDAPGGVATDGSGNYVFECLPQGDFRVVMNPVSGISSTPTETNPNLNGDQNDNGYPDDTTLYPGMLISGIVTLTPGYIGAAGNNIISMSIGHTADPTVDFGLTLSPTQVKMDRFEAFYKGDDIVLKWSTGGEADNLGFNIYRSNGGGSELLNPAPIAGSMLRTNVRMNITGDDYRWVDTDPQAGALYYLEDIDLDGTRTLHGPIRPQFDLSQKADGAKSPLLSEIGRGRNNYAQKYVVVEPGSDSFYSGSSEDGDIDVQRKIAATGGVKISVRGADRYRVSFSQLRAAGFNIASDTSTWQLFVDGEEVPMTIKTEQNVGHIEFFGNGFDSRFTDKQVFYLISGNRTGERLETVRESANEEPNARSFRVTSVRKDRIFYVSSILNGEDENWFGLPVMSTADAVQEIEALAPHNGAAENARLRLRLQGLSDTDHLVNVSFNGELLGTVSYPAKENGEFEFDVPMSLVDEGANSISLRSSGGPDDVSVIEEVSLRYSQKYEARGGQIRFSVEAGRSARIGGFGEADIDVFELGQNGRAVRKLLVDVEQFEGAYAFTVNAGGHKREFAAFERGYLPRTQPGVERELPSRWSHSGNGAELLIIAPQAFGKPASRLSKLRTNQGIKTEVVYVEDIYDEYGFGRKSDTAIKDFLRDASTNWSNAPKYLVLFGDSSFDMRNSQGQADRDLVPTRLFDSTNLETASDAWFVDFDDDGIEDIAVGRLPAGDFEEANAMVAKLERYDRQGERKNRTNLLVADSGFEALNQRLETMLPEGVSGLRLNRSGSTDRVLHDRIIDAINGNAMVVTYTGHGSTRIWANSSVFHSNDAAGLENSRLSFFIALSCLNGFTHNMGSNSIGEDLFKSENGAFAVWASSGSTYTDNQIGMGEMVTRRMFDGATRIGDLTREAKRSTQDRDARMTWQLIGDPTTVIR